MEYPIDGKIQAYVTTFEKGKWYTCVNTKSSMFTEGKSYMCVRDSGVNQLITNRYTLVCCDTLSSKFVEHQD